MCMNVKKSSPEVIEIVGTIVPPSKLSLFNFDELNEDTGTHFMLHEFMHNGSNRTIKVAAIDLDFDDDG